MAGRGGAPGALGQRRAGVLPGGRRRAPAGPVTPRPMWPRVLRACTAASQRHHPSRRPHQARSRRGSRSPSWSGSRGARGGARRRPTPAWSSGRPRGRKGRRAPGRSWLSSAWVSGPRSPAPRRGRTRPPRLGFAARASGAGTARARACCGLRPGWATPAAEPPLPPLGIAAASAREPCAGRRVCAGAWVRRQRLFSRPGPPALGLVATGDGDLQSCGQRRGRLSPEEVVSCRSWGRGGCWMEMGLRMPGRTELGEYSLLRPWSWPV